MAKCFLQPYGTNRMAGSGGRKAMFEANAVVSFQGWPERAPMTPYQALISINSVVNLMPISLRLRSITSEIGFHSGFTLGATNLMSVMLTARNRSFAFCGS